MSEKNQERDVYVAIADPTRGIKNGRCIIRFSVYKSSSKLAKRVMENDSRLMNF